jgi:N-methylhydantoinase A/oxoprolinase/acetone carboxylase beta subunit|tara:strand:- start:451 stop:2535 length:2085 start_codon:yes stop_codon:yes gene_type:complete
MHPLRLGIDTGGTYTDAVLLDDHGAVVSTAKALTTHHQLTAGIHEALGQLPKEQLGQSALVSLSTTLATNAVVEGRGTPVCLLLAGYTPKQVDQAQLEQIVRGGGCTLITGGHDAGGAEREVLDLARARQAILEQRDEVAAFGVSSLFGVRNPEHERRLRKLVNSLTDKPVTCGHELASQLDAPRRALTVALNASLIPYIDELIRAIQTILGEYRISAPLMMVKGDGSLISAELALSRPVETILSGPAASVMGATLMHRQDNAIIADMGGTTTDIAIVTQGQPVVSAKATVIGEWRPMIEAVRVFSVGLGGDSEARFQGGVGLAIGPRRVIPMSLLAHRNPEILAILEQRVTAPASARSNRFAVPIFAEASQRRKFSQIEEKAWQRLSEGPLDLEEIAETDRELTRAVARLVRGGVAIYSGFTPTDAAHVLGKVDHWSVRAAELAAVIWARQMRQIYGWGQFDLADPAAPSQVVHDYVIKAICQTLVSACLATDPQQHNHAERERTARLFSEWITGFTPMDAGLFSVQLDPERTLVAVGAPATVYYPAVAEQFRIPLALPEHAAVANAIGAVAGSIVQRVQITVTQPIQGIFRVFRPDGPADHANLEQALSDAEFQATALARVHAANAGAQEIRTSVARDLDSVDDPDSPAVVFFEGRITATATGRPAVGSGPAALPETATSVQSRADPSNQQN